MFQLEVRVLEGRNMIRADTFSPSDPYAEAGIRGGSQVFKTQVVSNTSNPAWNAPFTFTGARRDDILVLRIMDFDPKGVHALLGEADINLSPYLNQGWKDFWVQLWMEKRSFLSTLMRRRSKNQVNWVRAPGDVHIQLSWSQIGGTQQNLQQQQQVPYTQGAQSQMSPALTNTQPVATTAQQSSFNTPSSVQPVTQGYGTQGYNTQSQVLSGQPMGSHQGFNTGVTTQPSTYGSQGIATQPMGSQGLPSQTSMGTQGVSTSQSLDPRIGSQGVSSQGFSSQPPVTSSQPTNLQTSSMSQPTQPRIVVQGTQVPPYV